MKAQIDMHRVVSGDREDSVLLDIIDGASGLRVTSVELTLANFTKALTGMSHTEATFKHLPDADDVVNYGKTQETVSVSLDWNDRLGLDELNMMIARVLRNNPGWELFHDGRGIRQNGNGHRITLVRYVDEVTS